MRRHRLVLLDLWMPLMDGWEFLRRQKSDPSIADIPVVVLSALPPASLDGADTVLKKPVDPERPIKKIHQAPLRQVEECSGSEFGFFALAAGTRWSEREC